MDTNRCSPPLAMPAPKSGLNKQSSPPSKLDRYLAKKMLEFSGYPQITIQLWDDSVITSQSTDDKSKSTVRFNHRSALRNVARQNEIGFGDAYCDGDVQVDGDLVEFLCEMFSCTRRAKKEASMSARLLKTLTMKKARVNTLGGSKSNIHHHYDLGNEFYSLWLDQEAMQYTCAYFPTEDMSIETAQVAKMDHVCRKLELKPGQTVVEAGCGWGGLALHMAKNYGVSVKAYNISHEQIAYATERAKQLGITDRVEYIEDDYRNVDGEFDVFVSVGMLEHVGHQNYSVLGSVVDRCLAKNGRALIHSIGRNVSQLMSAWIEKRIFPGAYPPTIREMMDILEPYNFSVLDIENLRLHYAETLRHWLHRYNQHEKAVLNMFDERFVRAWRLYLSGSIAAFEVGALQLFQMVFARGEDNSIPMSREHQYRY